MIDNKSIFYKEWFEKGVQSINDLINEDRTYLILDQFQEKYKIVEIFCHLLSF
jgi:negative regulator of replication initiation